MMKTLLTKKEANINAMTGIAYVLMVLAIVAGVGILVAAQFNTTAFAMGAPYNVSTQGWFTNIFSAYSTLGSLLGVVVIAMIGFAIISFIGGNKPQ